MENTRESVRKPSGNLYGNDGILCSETCGALRNPAFCLHSAILIGLFGAELDGSPVFRKILRKLLQSNKDAGKIGGQY